MKKKENEVDETRVVANPNPNFGVTVEKGDYANALSLNLKLANLPPIDIYDSDQVEQRVIQFFETMAEYDLKPAVSSFGLALGMTRTQVQEVVANGVKSRYFIDLPQRSAEIIKKSYTILETIWDNNFLGGKINPVVGIFYGKNNFGYQDKVEQVVINEQQTNEPTVDDIKKKYLD